jgi:hypothetical protein
VPPDAFKFRTLTGAEINWPITTVVVLNWLDTYYPNLSYTRATTPVPAAVTWLGSRTDFTAYPYDTVPNCMQSVFGLREDLAILYNQRYLGEICASYDVVMPSADRAGFIADEDEAIISAAYNDGAIQWFESENDEDNDAVNDPDVTAGYSWPGYNSGGPAGSKDAFSHLNDVYPFLTGHELQILEEWNMNQETDMKNRIGNASGISDSQVQALMNALKDPQID